MKKFIKLLIDFTANSCCYITATFPVFPFSSIDSLVHGKVFPLPWKSYCCIYILYKWLSALYEGKLKAIGTYFSYLFFSLCFTHIFIHPLSFLPLSWEEKEICLYFRTVFSLYSFFPPLYLYSFLVLLPIEMFMSLTDLNKQCTAKLHF